MANARELTDLHLTTYTAVAPIGVGVCNVCHGAPGTGYARCESCNKTIRQVSIPVERIVPISLYRTASQLHHVLRGYKDNIDGDVRSDLTRQVAALLYRFVSEHRGCLERFMGTWDAVVVVPSTREPSSLAHPLVRALLMAPGLREQLISPLTPGSVKIGHRVASDDGFACANEVAGRRVLLVDDTFTSGARMQSAASALNRAGGSVVGAIVVGRVIDTEFSSEALAMWNQARSYPFDFTRCCVH